MKILITYALEAERGSWHIPGHELFFCRTGVGKVSAALHTYEHAHELKPDLVLAVGTAGTLHHQVGDIVVADKFVDRDLEKIAHLGVSFQLNFTDEMGVFAFRQVIDATVSTGDTFQENADDSSAGAWADVFDMEAFGGAQACKMLGIPFIAVKYITDVIGQNSIKHWEEKLEDARKGLEGFLKTLFE
jgi:adenosylhomocysteine nucleosidase